MTKPSYVNLQPGEEILTIAASNIYAAYIATGQVGDNVEAMLERAAKEAIRLAQLVDDNVIVPGEMRGH